LSPQGIAQVLRHLPADRDPNLIVGTETHDDAGVYRLTDDLALVQTIDFFPPVVDDPFVYGQIAAANALSDVYAMGGTPKTVLNLVCYPDDKEPSLEWLGRILEGGAERCSAAGAVIVGGHTVRDAEIKFGMAVTGVTLVLELGRLPLIPGADRLAAQKHFRTRAGRTNADYVRGGLRVEGRPDPVRLEFFYDAQTSGGLLVSVPADRAEALVDNV